MKASATITMNASALARLRNFAKAQKRSVSQQLEVILEQHFATVEAPAAAPVKRKRTETAAA